MGQSVFSHPAKVIKMSQEMTGPDRDNMFFRIVVSDKFSDNHANDCYDSL